MRLQLEYIIKIDHIQFVKPNLYYLNNYDFERHTKAVKITKFVK